MIARGVLLLLLLSGVSSATADEASVAQWHTITLSFSGPETAEAADENPFTDYRLLVTFRHDESSCTVRGFYAADGISAESGADSGNVWQVRFCPDQIGAWTYSADLRTGMDIAISDDSAAGRNVTIDNASGAFRVTANTKRSRDFRSRGRLVADDGYLRFVDSDERWLKHGTDSPENLLAYSDFDGTRRLSTETTSGEAKTTEELHHYEPHVKDWVEGDPTWRKGRGRGLIGGINYLSSVDVNAAYFLTLNIGGDGKDV